MFALSKIVVIITVYQNCITFLNFSGKIYPPCKKVTPVERLSAISKLGGKHMRAWDRDRKKSYAALDLMIESGSFDPYIVCKELMNRRPDLTMGLARIHVSGYLLRDKRSEDGKKRYPQGKPEFDAMKEFDDFAPVGYKVCPDRCDWGWVVLNEVACNTCGGRGFVNMDGSIAEGLGVLAHTKESNNG